MFSRIMKSIKKNAKCVAKCVGIGVATLGTTAVEIAGSIELMNKIVDGCDEDNPANFAQTLGVVATSIGAGMVESATVIGGMALIEHEIEENWE